MLSRQNEFIEVTDSNGKIISVEVFFKEIEKVFSGNFDRYSKNIIPLSLAYAGDKYPFEAMMFAIGFLSGYAAKKKGLRIKYKGNERIPKIFFQMVYDLKLKLDNGRKNL